MKRKIVFLLCTLAILFAGCRSRKEAPSQPPAPKPPVVVKPEPEPETFSTFNGTFTCTAGGITVNGLVRMQRDSVIWMSATKLIELGRLKATPDSVTAYVKPLNQYLRDGIRKLQSRYKTDLDYKMLQNVLTGQPVNTPSLRATYSDTVSVNGLPFPSHIKIDILDHRLRKSVVIKYSKIELNQPLTYPITIPKSASPLDLNF